MGSPQFLFTHSVVNVEYCLQLMACLKGHIAMPIQSQHVSSCDSPNFVRHILEHYEANAGAPLSRKGAHDQGNETGDVSRLGHSSLCLPDEFEAGGASTF
jgi:hypothetical protein